MSRFLTIQKTSEKISRFFKHVAACAIVALSAGVASQSASAQTPASIVFTKAYTGDTTKILTQPAITITASCSSGSKTVTFTPPATGTITGVVGDRCENFVETVAGAVLSAGYVMVAPGPGVFSDRVVFLNVGPSAAVTVTNQITPLTSTITTTYTGDTTKLISPVPIFVSIRCSITQYQRISFTPPASGTFAVHAGDVCTAIIDGVGDDGVGGIGLAPGYLYRFGLGAEGNPINFTIANAGVALAADLPIVPNYVPITVSKDYSGDTVPSRVTTQPAITVTLNCSFSGLRTVTFTPPATGIINIFQTGQYGVVEICNDVNETAATGAVLEPGYQLAPTARATIACLVDTVRPPDRDGGTDRSKSSAGPECTDFSVDYSKANPRFIVTNFIEPTVPASLTVTKSYTGDVSKLLTQPTITVTASCSISGAKTVTFTPPATGAITGVVGDVCSTFAETAASGAVLAGGAVMGSPGAATFSSASATLAAGSNTLTVTNAITSPMSAMVTIRKIYSGDTSPTKVTTQPSITVTASCSNSGAKTATFTPPAISGFSALVGEICGNFVETAATGAVLAGGYTMSAPSAAAFSLPSFMVINGTNELMVTNALTAPATATLTVTKAYSGDTVPTKVTTQPSITVTASCSISGAKTVTFTPPATGTITGVVGDVCGTFAETAATGAVLAGGYAMGAASAATFGTASVTLAEGSNAVTVTNALTAPGAATLDVTKAYSGDTSPSKVTTQPSITVTATCSISGAKTVTFTPPATGTITGVVGDVCTTFAESASTGAVLSGGYAMGAASAATFSTASVTLAAGSNALTVTNALTAPGVATLNVTKAYSGDTTPSKVTTQPSITVTANCSISGAKTVTFTPPATGTITGVVGDVCGTFAETAASGAVLASGFAMSAASAGTFDKSSVTLAAAPGAITVSNVITSLGTPNLRSKLGTGSGALVPGSTFTIPVTFYNDGPVDAINALFTVQLPVGLVGVQVGGGGSYNATTGAVSWPSVALMPVGQSTFSISFLAPAGSFNVRSGISSSNEASTSLADNPDTRAFAAAEPVQSVPTLSNYGLLLMSLLLAGFVAVGKRKAI